MTNNHHDDTTDDHPTNPTIGTTFDRQLARIAAGAYDDSQKVRKAMMNRVRDIIRKKNEDIPFDQVEEEKDEDEKDYDSKYKDGNLPDILTDMLDRGKLSKDEFDYLNRMLDTADAAAKVEREYEQVMGITAREPIFTDWLDHTYGVSTTLTAKLIHRFGYCEKFDKVSEIWAYSGFAPGRDKRVKGQQLSYDPEAKTLGWLVADRIIMQGERPPGPQYKAWFYDPYKATQLERMERKENDQCIKCGDDMPDSETRVTYTEAEDREFDVCPSCYSRLTENGEGIPSAPVSLGHADTRARRYLAKGFLKHYWYFTRKFKGLPTPDEWIVTHGGHEKRLDTPENPEWALAQLRGYTYTPPDERSDAAADGGAEEAE